MINHGYWEAYTPTETPAGAPANAIYWTDGSRDWYEFSRQNWNVIAGADTSGTIKISIVDCFISCISTDVTRLMLPTRFQLLELEVGDATPEIGWYYDGSVFTPERPYRSAEERRAALQNISARQLWLMARQVGITKAQVLATLEPAEGDTDEVLEKKEVLYIELTEPPLAGFLRDSPAAEDFREYMGLPPEQFDDMWRMAQEI